MYGNRDRETNKLYDLGNSWNQHYHFYDYRGETNMKKMLDYDRYALDYIKRAQEAIEAMQEYRLDLAAFAAAQACKPYRRELRLIRDRRWRGESVYYNIGIYRIFDNGEEAELYEQYTGTERHTALKRYAELLKQYPGITAIKDIEKRYWEK